MPAPSSSRNLPVMPNSGNWTLSPSRSTTSTGTVESHMGCTVTGTVVLNAYRVWVTAPTTLRVLNGICSAVRPPSGPRTSYVCVAKSRTTPNCVSPSRPINRSTDKFSTTRALSVLVTPPNVTGTFISHLGLTPGCRLSNDPNVHGYTACSNTRPAASCNCLARPALINTGPAPESSRVSNLSSPLGPAATDWMYGTSIAAHTLVTPFFLWLRLVTPPTKNARPKRDS